jgi:hypothetical protein
MDPGLEQTRIHTSIVVLLLFFINHFIYISDRRRVKVNRNLVNLHEGFGSK